MSIRTLARFTIGLAMGLALVAAPAALSAQAAGTFSLSGDRAEIYNIAGFVRVQAGSGSDVVVEIDVGGADGDELTAWEDVTLDEVGRSDRRGVALVWRGDALEQHRTGGAEALVAGAEELVEILVTHCLDHLDRNELVEASRERAVVLEQDLDAVGQARALHTRDGQLALNRQPTSHHGLPT